MWTYKTPLRNRIFINNKEIKTKWLQTRSTSYRLLLKHTHTSSNVATHTPVTTDTNRGLWSSSKGRRSSTTSVSCWGLTQMNTRSLLLTTSSVERLTAELRDKRTAWEPNWFTGTLNGHEHRKTLSIHKPEYKGKNTGQNLKCFCFDVMKVYK